MALQTGVARAAAALEHLCDTGVDGEELLAAVDAEVTKVVPSDGTFWAGLDPSTLLSTAPARVHNLDPGQCGNFWHLEFQGSDVNLMRDLARRTVPAAALRLSTDGRPARSARWRDFLAPQGYDDELRAMLRVGGTSWGFVALYRDKGRAAFTHQEVAAVHALGGVVATALRRHATRTLDRPAHLPGGPGLLVVDGENLPVSGNAEAVPWLEELASPPAPRLTPAARQLLENLAGREVTLGLGLPTAVMSVVNHARAVRAGLEPGPARLRLRSRHGRWVLLHASCLGTSDTSGAVAGDLVAVVLEAAQSADIAPIIVEAYALSPREWQITRAIAQGCGTQEIATSLFLSPHTVRDYVKSVFEKVGVSSRGELVAKLFADHYVDRMREGTVHA